MKGVNHCGLFHVTARPLGIKETRTRRRDDRACTFTVDRTGLKYINRELKKEPHGVTSKRGAGFSTGRERDRQETSEQERRRK